MQVFLPYPSFEQSLRCLDYRRLGKQRVEASQILRTLTEGRKAWRNHPAVLMFKGHTGALGLYYNLCIDEWTSRGYRNNMAHWPLNSPKQLMPQWLGDEQFHASHRSNLLRKDPVFYGRYGWTEGPNLPYVWPVRKGTS